MRLCSLPIAVFGDWANHLAPLPSSPLLILVCSPSLSLWPGYDGTLTWWKSWNWSSTRALATCSGVSSVRSEPLGARRSASLM